MAHLERVVVLVDMDCFYCQVEEKLNPNIKGKPIAVVQYNAWRGGGIIAVNYPARERGVTRHMRGDEAQTKCPDIILCKVPCVRGKADLTKYREAGKDVAAVLQKFSDILQRASIDEAYLDITESVNKRLAELQREIIGDDISSTYVYGSDKNDFIYDLYNNSTDNEANLKLIVGAIIVEEIRTAVYNETGYQCSAGIAHNKILSKLACGFNKPNKQTVLPHVNVPALYEELPIKKIKSLGGKFGETLAEDLNITYMSELGQFSEKTLQEKYDTKIGSWLYNIARGIDMELVTSRLCPKSIGCCKRFPGVNSLNTPQNVEHWIGELAQEVSERLNQDLQEYNRRASHMIVHYTLKPDGKKPIASTKTRSLVSYEQSKIASDAFEIVHKANTLNANQYVCKVTYLGISAGKFVETTQSIKQFFQTSSKNEELSNSVADVTEVTAINASKFDEKPKSIQQFFLKSVQNEKGEPLNSFADITDVTDVSKFDEKPKSIQQCFLKSIQNEKEELSDVITNVTKANKSNNTVEKLENSNQNIDTESKTQNTSSFFTNMLRNKVVDQPTSNVLEMECESTVEEQILSETTSENTKMCLDCRKLIPLEDFESHCDYHMAIKIAAEDTEPKKLVITTQEVNIESKKSNINKYFSKSIDDEENYEICDECKQKVALDQFLDHLDYHAAKKLHYEINNINKVETVKVKLKTNDSSKKNILKRKNLGKISKNNDKKLKSIASFFKPPSS